MQAKAATEEARRGQKLIIGPWPHWVNRERALNGVDFGDDALIDLDGYIRRFFDRWLKGERNRIDEERPVHVFVLGANEWWEDNTWPLPGTEYTPYYFHSGGRANTLLGDGTLSTETPGAETPDSYVYDPRDPVRFLWNLRDGPVDDRLVSLRQDVVCYTSDVLTEPLDVVGPVECVLHATSSAPDTDWHVRLVDVYPDGSARFLCHGALRARFRESYERPKLMQPGERYEFRIGMDAAGNRFLPGHRIRVELTSSWFPKYDRNMNTGADNNFLDASPQPAQQTILHEASAPSHIVLPVVRRGST
jgi:putative CocE/NonD family hydrolase